MRNLGWRPWCAAVAGLLAMLVFAFQPPAAAGTASQPRREYDTVTVTAHVAGRLAIVLEPNQGLAVAKSNVGYTLSIDDVSGRQVWTAVASPL